mgnify:FL=1
MATSCPVCNDFFPKVKQVEEHLRTVHPLEKTPYACPECPLRFGSRKALALHTKKKHDATSSLKRPREWEAEDDCDEPAGSERTFDGTLTEWVTDRYNHKVPAPERLAISTIERVRGFRDRVRFNDDEETLETVLTTGDETIQMDALDSWLDTDIAQNELQTVNNHVRYLRILVLFYVDCGVPVKPAVLEYVEELVVDTQSKTARSTTTLNMLKLEDPFALAFIRDTVVDALLREQVEYIDTTILASMPGTFKPSPEFCERLRNWLELALRFTNIPCRIQCSRDLEMPETTSTTYVAKLTVRDGQYCRLINQDKTAGSHQPLLLPMGPLLSAYMYVYLTYCRGKTAEDGFVFRSQRGNRWSRPSRDLKSYLDTVLGIPVQEVDPTGRFIHGSRSIAMATFAIRVGFDQQKMHGFARLMRHSSTTNERFYSMWQHRALSNHAIDVFADAMALGFNSVTAVPTNYTPVCLRFPPGAIISQFRRGVAVKGVTPCYGTRSIGTQTGSAEVVTSDIGSGRMQEVDVAATVPACRKCANFSLLLFGPFGSARRKRYFGRYYLACPTCNRSTENDGGRHVLHECLWYPLGYLPTCPSNSSRPRNMAAIQNHIALASTPV